MEIAFPGFFLKSLLRHEVRGSVFLFRFPKPEYEHHMTRLGCASHLRIFLTALAKRWPDGIRFPTVHTDLRQ